MSADSQFKSHVCTIKIEPTISSNSFSTSSSTRTSTSIPTEKFVVTPEEQFELTAYSKYFNQCLSTDPDLNYLLPINIYSTDLLFKIKDGLLLSKFINTIISNTIDLRTLNYRLPNEPLKWQSIVENLNLCISAAKSIGCTMKQNNEQNYKYLQIEKNLNLSDIATNNNRTSIGTFTSTNTSSSELGFSQLQLLHCTQPSIVIEFLYQLIKIKLLKNISLKNYSQLNILTNINNNIFTIEQLYIASPEQLLLRWCNYHIMEYKINMKNFSTDLMDGSIYNFILEKIESYQQKYNSDYISNKIILSTDKSLTSTDNSLIQNIFQRIEQLSILHFHDENTILSGNERLNLLFCAILFNFCIAIEKNIKMEAKELENISSYLHSDDDRETTACRMWMNGAGLSNVYIHHLYHDVKDGLVLLKLLDWLESQTVNWKIVELNPNNKFKSITNCNIFLKLCSEVPPFHFSLVGIGGSDIYGKEKNIEYFE
jgi:plastin-1